MKIQYFTLIVSLTLLIFSPSLLSKDSDEYYEQALSAFHLGKANEAVIYLKNVFQQEPNHLPGKVLLGNIYFTQGLVEQTEIEMLEALEAGADINLIIKPLGYSYLAQNKITYLLELEKYSKRLSTPNYFEWNLLKAQAYVAIDKPGYAKSQFEKALRLKKDKRLLNSFASFLTKQKDFKRAQDLISESMEIDPNNAKTWVAQSQLLLHQNSFSEAIQALQKAYSITPNDPKAIRLLAFLNIKIGNLVKAEVYLEDILELFPNDSSAILMKAWLMSNRGENDVVKQSLTDLQNRFSLITDRRSLKYDNISYIQGASEFVSNNWLKAREHLTRYLETNNDHFSTIQMLSQIHYKLDGPQAALRFLESKEKQIVKNLGLSVKLVEFYIETGQLSSAISFLNLVELNFKNNPYINYVSAIIERSRGKDLLALNYLERITDSTEKALDIEALKVEIYFSLNQMEKAKLKIDQLIKAAPNNTKVNNLLAVYLIKTGEITRALDILNRLITYSPKDKLSRYNRAVIGAINNEHGLAVGLLNQLLHEDPNHVNSQLLLIRIFMEQEQFDKAQSRGEKFLLRNPNNIAIKELLTEIHIQRTEWVLAYKYSLQLLNFNNLKGAYIEQNVHILIALDRLPEASKKLGILKGLWQKDGIKLIDLAKLYYKIGDVTEAISTLTKASTLSSNNSQIELLLIEYYASNDQFNLANGLITKLESNYKDNVQFYIIKGDVFLAQSKNQAALASYKNALKLNANSNLALVKLYQLAKVGVATESFTRLIQTKLKQSPNVIWLRRLSADHYVNIGKPKLAIEEYQYLITNAQLNNDSLILNNLANLTMDTDLVKAKDYAEQAFNLDNNNATILDTYGWILAVSEEYKLALSLLRKALSFDASNKEARYHLAYVLFHIERKAEAKRELEAILAANQTFTGLEEANALLAQINESNL